MISIIIPNLQGGGAERVAINLANAWSAWGHQVEFALMDPSGDFIDCVSPEIKIYNLSCNRFRQVPWSLMRYLREKKPDVTFVHMWPLTSIGVLSWFLAGKPGKIFVCEHTSLSDHVRLDMKTPLPVFKKILQLSHPKASGVVSVSFGAAKDLASLAGLPEQRVDVIYNPVVSSELPTLHRSPVADDREILWGGKFRNLLLSVGNLKASKNYRLLLRAFAKVASELDASLVILGEGSLRPALEQDVRDLRLQGRVVLPGFSANPTRWYRCADFLVLSSEFEGFANVLAEALAFGVPVVSTDCPHGPAEILEQGRHGELVAVGDADELANGIRRAVSRHWDPEALQKRALDFSIPKQAQAYLDLFSRS